MATVLFNGPVLSRPRERRPLATFLQLLLVGSLTAGLALSATPAKASGPWDGIQQWETGTISRVVDGDTLMVVDEVTGKESRIRLLGINAPEIDTKRHGGQCGGWQARDAMLELAPVGTRVRLASVDRSSTGRKRPQRVVLAWNPVSQQFDQDLGWAMAERGWGAWYTVAREAAMSSLYREAIEGAQARGIGMWNPTLCGTLEQPSASVELRINRAPEGSTALNDEWVSVRNTGPEPLDLTGWMLRDSGLKGWYVFPPGSVLAPGDYRVVHTGSGTPGTPRGQDVYAGAKVMLYPNPGTGPALLGDGAYLLDRYGNYRFWREYPCTASCGQDPLFGTLVVDAISIGERPGPDRVKTQWIRLANRGATPACLDGYRLTTGTSTYRFPAGTCVPGFGTWTLNIGQGRSTATNVYWGLTTPALWRSGTVTITSDLEQLAATGSW